MTENPKNKYRYFDLIFTLINAISIVLIAIFILDNLIVSMIFVAIVVLIATVFLIYWNTRNPFNIYLVRSFAFNNLFFTFVALLIYYSLVSPVPQFQLGFFFLLFPPIFYLVFSFRFSYISMVMDKRTGAALAVTGRTKAAQRYFFKDTLENKMHRREEIAKLKKANPHKNIIVLAIVLAINSLIALSLGFF